MRDHFLKLKSRLELNPTLDKLVSARHTTVRDYIKNNNSNVKDSKLIGSLQRKTRIQPTENSKVDIDVLVIMGEFYGWVPGDQGITPQQAMTDLHFTVSNSDRYSSKNPTQDAPTVSLTYDDEINVELVPAYIDNIGVDQNGNHLGLKGRGYWVVKNGRWEICDYDYEAEYISTVNISNDGHLIPTIKMIKAIKRNYFSHIDSFPLEIIASRVIPIAVNLKKKGNLPIHYYDLLETFFSYAGLFLSSPLKIPGSKSPPIVLDSATVDSLNKTFKTIGDYIKVINIESVQNKKIEMWRKLFGDCFPVTIN